MAIPRTGNAISSLNRLRRDELDSRRQARTILHPGEVAGGLSPARLLTTTLGGQLRPITAKDLAQFRANVAELGSKARQGLTASEALSLSRAIDVERAKGQIKYSMPARLQAGTIHFVTDSGPRSKVTRHHVGVQFAQYSTALARPGTPTQAAQWLAKESALRFECDCQHFRYFLRFVATAGGWVLNRPEHGLPKLKNPTLDGACCKHIARVMTDIQSSVGLRQRIAQMVEADRARIDKPGKAKPKLFTISQREAEAMLPKHSRRIVAIKPGQRGAQLPGTATRADITRAMATLQQRTDISSGAILRALQNLLNQPQQKGTQ
ncbi:MAG: hypothetical protein ACREXG_00920 [Polaromonas sp.]